MTVKKGGREIKKPCRGRWSLRKKYKLGISTERKVKGHLFESLPGDEEIGKAQGRERTSD